MTATLNPLYRFDTLVVGAANRLAFTAAKAVAESPGTVYNPLFVYARPGLGKTHLLMGIGHAARAINPNLSVEYLTLDEFVESFHAAIAAGQGDAYRRRFNDVDLLLVDDVQFLTHRREMQSELLRLTDTLQSANRQIVLTSDRPPSEIEALDERLIRRFAGGLVIDVSSPDYETRVAILRRKAEERRATFADGVLEAVASLAIDNVRELLGALNRLVAFQAVSDTPLQPAQARALAGGEETERSEKTDGSVRKPAAPSGQSTPDEFGDFLSEVSATVSQQVDSWRTKVAAAILRWEGEGFRTTRIEPLLQQEMTVDPEEVLRQFAADVGRLQSLHAEAMELAPDLAGSTAFRDPDDIVGAEALTQRARQGAHPPPAPSPLWKLDDLVEAPSNRMALQAARAVVAEPAARYNPLVIVGGSGVGKTHLLHAIGNAMSGSSRGPVACLSAHEFTSELIEAIDRNGVGAWRARYRSASAFLLDDVHLVADKDRTQDELFVLFNFLIESGRQMIFSSGVPLSELTAVEARLRTRLEGGLVVDLPAPDREMRQQVLQRAFQGKPAGPDAELLDYLGSRPVDSVRALQGLLQRVLNAAESKGVLPSAALAREVLEAPAPKPPRRWTGSRSSGIVAPASGARSREKIVWEWPDVGDRIVEDWALMAIKGSLKEASLPDVIQLLFLGRRTGCLALADRHNFGTIYLDEGQITFATIVNRRDRLGDLLIRKGRITAEQLEQAIAAQEDDREHKLGEILVGLGTLTRTELEDYMRLQIEEAVYYLFTWTAGTFNFEAGVKPESEDFLVRISPEALLLEGARRVDEWSLIEKKIPSFDLIFSVDQNHITQSAPTLSPEQQRLLPLVDGTRDVQHLIDESGLVEFQVGKALFGLITAGFAHRVGTSTAAAPKANDSRVDEHRNLGIAFYKAGMLEEALREFRRVTDLRPSDGTAPLFLGLIAVRQARWEDAAEALRQASESGVPKPAALHNLGFALEQLGRLDEAEAAYGDAAGRAREDARIVLGWSIVALKRGDNQVAQARLIQARELFNGKPVPAMWFWASSLACAGLDDAEGALKAARDGVAAYPSHAVLQNNLAVLLELSGDIEGAEAMLRAALAEDPALPQVSKNLADILYRNGRYDEAAEAYERAAKLSPELGDDLYFKLGNIAYKKRDHARARESWAQATSLNPGHQLARANLEMLDLSQ